MINFSIAGRPNKDEIYLYIRLNSNSDNKRIALGIKVPSANFNCKTNSLIKKGNFDYAYHKELLNSLEIKVSEIIRTANLENWSFDQTAEHIIVKLKGGEVKKIGVLKLFREWATVGTATKTNPSRQNLYSYHIFEEFVKKKDITFASVNYAFYSDYINFLRIKKKLKENTIGTHIKNLKAVMNEGLKRKLHNNNDFKSFAKPYSEKTNVNLTEKEIKLLYKAKLHGEKETVRDVFVLGCYVAQRFSDYSRISQEDIKSGFLTILQQKTKHRIIIPVHPIVQEILNKYNGRLPKIHLNKINEDIKLIAKDLKINDKILISETKAGVKTERYVEKWELISSHTARKSGVTNALRAGVPIEDCMYLAGIKSLAVFKIYAGLTDLEYSQRLAKSDFFKNNSNEQIIRYVEETLLSNENPKWLEMLKKEFALKKK